MVRCSDDEFLYHIWKANECVFATFLLTKKRTLDVLPLARHVLLCFMSPNSYQTFFRPRIKKVCVLILFSIPSISPPVILNSSRRLSLVAVGFGLLAETCAAQACQKLLWGFWHPRTFYWMSASSDWDRRGFNLRDDGVIVGCQPELEKGKFVGNLLLAEEGGKNKGDFVEWRTSSTSSQSRDNGRRDVVLFFFEPLLFF